MVEYFAMHLTPPEAAAALAEVDQARAAMRQVIRAHRGHYHLWIWGMTWIAMPLSVQFCGEIAFRWFGLICLPAVIGSIVVGATQSRQVKTPFNPRFLGAVLALVAFAAIFPLVLQARPQPKSLYAYTCLVVLQAYVIAGLWTDTYLLALGLILSALVLLGYFLLPGVFWWWMAAAGGGGLIASGFYVRHFWR